MDLDRAIRVLRLYCYHYEKSPSEAKGMLLTDREKLAVQELRDLVTEYSRLFAAEGDVAPVKAA